MAERICLLTRGSHDYGMGHLHRCCWMLEALRDSGRDLHLQVCCQSGEEAHALLSSRGIHASYADWLSMQHPLPECDLLLVDWLNCPVGFLYQCARSARRTMLLDDYGPETTQADVCLRSLLADIAPAHGREGRAEVYSGITYLQLSPELLRIRYGAEASQQAMATELSRPIERTPGPVHSIMLSFGGTPRLPQTEFALKLLRELEFAGRVIVKPAHPLTVIPAGLDVELHEDVEHFHELLSACDMCIIGGGLTLYEASFLGVPSLVLPVVDHQLATARKLNAAGCCLIGGKTDELNHNLAAGRLMELIGGANLRGRMTHNSTRLIDGFGLQRTLEIMFRLLGS
ncbi:MAG: hypothetical protein H7A35_16320 [Planctomycetales bacterium]|nr:hypothetical protein [bacterium]UNM08392.1 MAG: hypothetical protein H7A35_16320 [Planctomycetales bacterium]